MRNEAPGFPFVKMNKQKTITPLKRSEKYKINCKAKTLYKGGMFREFIKHNSRKALINKEFNEYVTLTGCWQLCKEEHLYISVCAK